MEQIKSLDLEVKQSKAQSQSQLRDLQTSYDAAMEQIKFLDSEVKQCKDELKSLK
jgi:predicted  nucleic acid-binding Zn-ribbon protein